MANQFWQRFTNVKRALFGSIPTEVGIPYPTYEAIRDKYGVMVTPKAARGFIALYACLEYVWGSIEALPFGIYRQDGNNRVAWHEHPYNVHVKGGLKYETFRKALGSRGRNCYLWGDGFLKRDYYKGAIEKYTPWLAEETRVYPFNDMMYAKNSRTKENVPYDDLFKFHDNFNEKTKRGETRISIAAESLEVPMISKKFHRDFLKKGTNIGGYLRWKESLTPDEMTERVGLWKDNYSGMQNATKIAGLDNDGQFIRLNMPMSDAQHMETTLYGDVEVCRLYNVEPQKIKDHSKSTFSNVHELNISSVVDTLLPVITYLEELINQEMFLFYPQYPGAYCKFNLSGLLRGNPAQRAALINVMMKWGIWDANDARALEDQNPVEDAFRNVPMNYMPAHLMEEKIKAEIGRILALTEKDKNSIK